MRLFQDRRILGIKSGIFVSLALLVLILTISISGCGDDKIIIRYVKYPPPINLISPAIDSFVTVNQPTFIWHSSTESVRYQLQVSSSPVFVTKVINVTTSDTAYTTASEISDNTYFWRVRGQNRDTLWGDWSDANIWSFYKSDYVNYIMPLANVQTYGTPQDVFVRNDTAYVADGQSDLTMVDATDKGNPYIIKNIDTLDDDFARAVYVSPIDTFPYAYVADTDGRVQVLNTADSTFLFNFSFGEQNLRDLAGGFYNDTLYVFIVRSRSGFNLANFSIYQMVYDPYPHNGPDYLINPIDLPANPEGVSVDGNYAYLACGELGLIIVDISELTNPYLLSELNLGGVCQAVAIDGDYAYMAADREGLYVINIADKSAPALVTQVNTAGRTKDVHISGNYAFLADGSAGLKVADITIPDSTHIVASYDTPYAYGVWADANGVYLCDRDEGLMIFDNLVSR